MHHLLFLVEKADNISKCITVHHSVTLPFQAKHSPFSQIFPTIRGRLNFGFSFGTEIGIKFSYGLVSFSVARTAASFGFG